MEEVSEKVDRFAFQDCESDIFRKILHSRNKVRFVYIYFSSAFVVGTKTSKTVVFTWSVQNTTSFYTFPRNLKPFCFGQDAA